MADALLRIDVDPRGIFARTFTALEQKYMQEGATKAAVEVAKAIQQKWAEKALQVFDRPVPLTQKAAQYKLQPGGFIVEVKLRDEIFKGNPPAKYLRAEVEGGIRAHKGFEQRLIDAGILGPREFAVPGQGAKLDAFGNVPRSQLNAILAQLGASFDVATRETPNSQGRRQRREARKLGHTTQYFAVRWKQNGLVPGVYQRKNFDRGNGKFNTIMPVLIFVKQTHYRVRYDIFGLAKGIYEQQFPFQFERELAKAVENAVIKGRT